MLTVHFDGGVVNHWQSATIKTSVDDLCTGVSLSLSQESPQNAFKAGINSVCKLFDEGQLIATTRMDEIVREVGESSHTINVQARSLAREMVDSQYSKTLRGKKLSQIIGEICADLKVPFTSSAPSDELVPEFSMQCESPSNQVLQLVRAANLFCLPTADGGIHLCPINQDQPVATLIYGRDMKSYTLRDTFRERFSIYQVKGNGIHDGFAFFHDPSHKPANGVVLDNEITYLRPLHVVAEKNQSIGACERRAKMECERRRARAHRLDITVAGWHDGQGKQGKLWAINTLLRVVIEPEGLDEVLLLSGVELKLDSSGGTTANLSLSYPAAWFENPDDRKKHFRRKPHEHKGKQ